MRTKNEIIYAVLERLNVQSDDSNISKELIAASIDNKRHRTTGVLAVRRRLAFSAFLFLVIDWGQTVPLGGVVVAHDETHHVLFLKFVTGTVCAFFGQFRQMG